MGKQMLNHEYFYTTKGAIPTRYILGSLHVSPTARGFASLSLSQSHTCPISHSSQNKGPLLRPSPSCTKVIMFL